MATESILRPGELKDILLREIAAADLTTADVSEVGTVLEVRDGIARIYGLQSAVASEMLEFTATETGETVAGLVLNLEEDTVGAAILCDYHTLRKATRSAGPAACSRCPPAPPCSAAWSTRSAGRWTVAERSRRPRRARSRWWRPASSCGSR